MDIEHFSRKPYRVVYTDFHTGKLVSVIRRPPEKIHDMLPTDKVELTSARSEDWVEGKEYTVKYISSRQPNTLQIQDEDDRTTFVSSYDLLLRGKVAYRQAAHRADDPVKNEYLLWP